MCGIVCYVGAKQAGPILLEGLKQLEYRGYDSAGMAVQDGESIACHRAVGKIANLERKLSGVDIKGASGIAHTRWATHGEPSEENAHPHSDSHGDVFVIHNGIIENYSALKKKIEKAGIAYRSQTDSEVLAHLISMNFDGIWARRYARPSDRWKGHSAWQPYTGAFRIKSSLPGGEAP